MMAAFYSSQVPYGDLIEYINIYKNINAIDIFDYKRFGGGAEIFILILMKVIFITTGGDEYLFLFFSFMLIQILLYIFCYKTDKKLALLYFGVFNFSILFVEGNAIYLRQCFSVLFFMLAVQYKGMFKYILYFLSFVSHLSSILNFMIYYCRDIFGYWKSVLVLVLTLTFSSYFYLDYILFSVNKLISYSDNDRFSGIRTNYLYFLVMFSFMFFYILTLTNKIVDDKRLLYLLFFNLILLVILKDVSSLSFRLAFLLFSFSPFFIYTFIESDEFSFKNKYFLLIVLMFFNSLSYFYGLYNISHMKNAFTFFGNNPVVISFSSAIFH